MARPKKEQLDYFPFDVGFFSDKKIRRLKVKFGTAGICVYIYLLCQTYGDKGYFLECDDDLICDISDDLGISESLTRQIMKYLFSRSLLREIRDGKLAKSVTIISAKSIQRRFQEAKKGSKRDVFVEAGYWLLEKAETLGFIKMRPNEDFSEKNGYFSEKNERKSEKNSTKERKEKESKVKDISSRARALLSEDQYAKLASMSSVSVVEKYLDKANEWLSKGGRYNDLYGTIVKWISEDGQVAEKNDDERSYDLSKWHERVESIDLENLNFKGGGQNS